MSYAYLFKYIIIGDTGMYFALLNILYSKIIISISMSIFTVLSAFIIIYICGFPIFNYLDYYLQYKLLSSYL